MRRQPAPSLSKIVSYETIKADRPPDTSAENKVPARFGSYTINGSSPRKLGSFDVNQNNGSPIAEVLALVARYEAEGRFEDAARMLMTARASQPRNVEVLGALAALARRRGKPDEAIRWLEEAAEIAPDDPSVVGNLGNLYRASGALDAAVSCYRRVLEAVPESVAALNNLGLALKARGDLDAAVETYRRALSIDPASAEVNSNLGVVLLARGDAAQAEAALRTALRARPDSVDVRTNLGSVLRALKRRDEAVALFQDVIATTPRHAEAHHNLANALREAGRLDAAVESYLQALRLDPENPRFLANLATAYTAIGDYDRAASVISRAKAHTKAVGPTDCGAVPAAHVPSGHGTGADRRDADAPEDLGTLRGVGWVHFLLGEDAEARALYERVLALKPDDATARHIMDSLDGRNTAAAPSGYVAALFDEYAPQFDQSLLEHLSYTGPAIARDLLTANLGVRRLEAVLDLGCGTGLIGQAVRDQFDVGYLEGVDLSSNMVEQAAAKGIYDTLAAADLLDHLAAGDRRFELVTAGDVLVYIGDLAPVFAAVRRRLSDDGHFLLTVEALDGDGYKLLRTGRYAHSANYVDRLAAQSGFRKVASQTHDIRRDLGRPIGGNAVLLRGA